LLSLHQELLLSLLKRPSTVGEGRKGEGDRDSYVPSFVGALANLAA
jgi:hypothetical protein